MKNLLIILLVVGLFSSCFTYNTDEPLFEEVTLEPFYLNGTIGTREINADLNIYSLTFFTNNAFGDRRWIWSQYEFKDLNNKVEQEIANRSDAEFVSKIDVQFIEKQSFVIEDLLNKPFFKRVDSTTTEPTGLGTIVLETEIGTLVMNSEFAQDEDSKTEVIEVSDGTYIDNPLLKVVTFNISDNFRVFKDDVWTGEKIDLRDVELKVLIKVRQS